MSKIVITGATGFIGKPLLEKFLDMGHEVYAVVRPDSPNYTKLQKMPKVHIIPLNMHEIEKLSQYVRQIDMFIHAAWEGIRGNVRMDEEIQLKNYECSVKAAKAAEEIGCKVFLGIGSQAEYGVQSEMISEQTKEEPQTEYGKMKLKTYRTLLEQYKNTEMRILWARVFSAYGFGDTSTSLIEICMEQMKAQQDILLTECIQMWNYVYIDDVVEAIYKLTLSEESRGIYNIASKDNRSLKEYVLELKELLQSKSKLQFGAVPYGATGAVGFTVNIDKLCKTLQWEPEVTFAEGIQKKIKIEESYENN